jgi:hypothetical protein
MSRFITPYPQTLGRLASSSGRMIRMFAKLTGGKIALKARACQLTDKPTNGSLPLKQRWS